MIVSERNRAVVLWTLGLLSLPAMAVLAISLGWAPEEMAQGGPLRLLGLALAPCPGCPLCGMSRAFCALSHLQPLDAMRFNPGVIAFYPLAWALACTGPALLVLRSIRR